MEARGRELTRGEDELDFRRFGTLQNMIWYENEARAREHVPVLEEWRQMAKGRYQVEGKESARSRREGREQVDSTVFP
jgi:hypothetical protein